ncbi:MAG TPA: YfhO family protein [Anaeromyxobacter sp.]
MPPPVTDRVLALALYFGAAWGAVALARRFAGPVSARTAILLAVLPLLFTGKAFLLGRLYGPVDLYASYPPWHAAAAASGISVPANPILSDLAFANIPWRAAVRDAIANGRFPFWNRFVLGGNPLLGSAQAAVFHPSTWLGVLLPLALSWTFSCAFTLFLALLGAFLCFRDFGASEGPALVGAAGWGFSTWMLFWAGWSVGPSTATFPLLVLGLRRLARGGPYGMAVTVAALLLSLAGGHPESLFHGVAAAGCLFVADLVVLARRGRRSLARPLAGALGAAALALLLAGPQLFPLLAAIPRSAEYRERSARLAAGRESQSVAAPEAARRLLPAVLPFSHGIYGRSPVQAERADGSGMPIAYAGAVLFPLALLGLLSRRPGSLAFGVLAAAGLLLGASAPGLLDLLTRLPGFALSLNYRLVFLAPFGLAGLAALGTEEAFVFPRRLALIAAGAAAAVLAAAFAAAPVFADRSLPREFVAGSLAAEVVPLVALALASGAVVAARRRGTAVALAAFSLLFLVVERAVEMGGVYPSQDASLLAPSAAPLDLARAAASPGGHRVVGAGTDLRPNGAALIGLEDVRGYESIVLDRFADTFPMWCTPQAASFNRVDDLTRPFLDFLGVRFAVAAPGASPPAGWLVRARSPELSLFENPRALPRAFVPRRVVALRDAAAVLEALRESRDFSETVWISGGGGEASNPPARVSLRTAGPDLLIEADSPAPALLATSVPDWPGWRAETDHGALALETVDHAFVGIRIPAGPSTVRLRYRPPGFEGGLMAFAAGVLAMCAAWWMKRRR